MSGDERSTAATQDSEEATAALAADGVQTVGNARPGGRTARTRAAVHKAVRELIEQNGETAPSILEVAARSGVHAATIYRRWRTPEALLLDVAVETVNEVSPIPVTGDLRADLTAYTHNLVTSTRRPGGLGFLNAMLTAARNPEIGPTGIQELVAPRLSHFQRMLDASGATELTPLDLFGLVLAPVYLGAMIGALPQAPDQTDREVAEIVDNVIAVRLYRSSPC
ncbi:TetR/AcrR family transcriptional regulator [Humibacter sp. RRB41]|uniref:TetR/AcrR family transcriptional regulator n=1 Tax=Humibacter sp. RRB41 TaxID=2919946 RepID=UPI001FAA6AC4|nr:TetR/AcrR family transcriptional regulator [Humibacter sp. RRB41]